MVEQDTNYVSPDKNQRTDKISPRIHVTAETTKANRMPEISASDRKH